MRVALLILIQNDGFYWTEKGKRLRYMLTAPAVSGQRLTPLGIIDDRKHEML
jgi:hypothetical protein